METLWQDLRHSARLLWKEPGFTVAVVLTLSLGIGANTAIFSVVNAVLLRPFPYQDSKQLAILWNSFPGRDNPRAWLTLGEYQSVNTQSHVFEQTALLIGGNMNLTGQGQSERLGGARVSASLFSTLGVRPALGRVLIPEEDQPAAAPVVVLSYSFWQRRFGSDPGIIGKPLTLDGQSYIVVGVLPSDFELSPEAVPLISGADPDVLLPLHLTEGELRDHTRGGCNVLARLKPGVTIAEAQAEMKTIAAQLAQDFPQQYPINSGFHIRVVSLLDQAVGEVRQALLLLLGAAGFVLLIACSNVANLLLSRTMSRQKEIAIRTAVGAHPWRIARQLLTESLLLAVVGGGLGLLLARWSIKGLLLLGPTDIPRLKEIVIDGQVGAFTFIISLLTGVIFGLAPALRASHIDLNDALKEGGRSLSGSGHHRLSSMLVVSEIALALVLLVGAGLLVRSFARLLKVDPGFNAENVFTARVTLPEYSEQARATFYKQLEERVGRLPGVEAAGLITGVPLSGVFSRNRFWIEGYQPSAAEEGGWADIRTCSPNYFRTLGIPLLKGRYFTGQDRRDAPGVVIVGENVARRYWPDKDPLGKRLKLGNAQSLSPWLTVVGVVGHVNQSGLDMDDGVALYFSSTQFTRIAMYLAVRTATDPANLTAAVKAEVRALDPGVPVYSVETMESRLSASLARRRFSLLLLGGFATAALLLAGIGIYSVMSYAVTQRTQEIGIRVALGAQIGDVLKLFIGQGMKLTFVGVLIGLGCAWALTRLLKTLLFGVSATDSLTFGMITLLLALVALLACWLPARRATKVDPMIAFKCE